MLASLHPPPLDQEHAAIRSLLDQRTRASHAQRDSIAFTDRSESPSLYSRGEYTPNPTPRGQVFPGNDLSILDDDDEAEEGRFAHPARDDTSPMLVAATPDPQESFFDNTPTLDDLCHDPIDAPEEVEGALRMSMLGPKMKFVSRAPWEMGAEDLLEELDESSDSTSMFSGKLGWRSKDKGKSPSKGLGIVTSGVPERDGTAKSSPSSPHSRISSIGVSFGFSRKQSPAAGESREDSLDINRPTRPQASPRYHSNVSSDDESLGSPLPQFRDLEQQRSFSPRSNYSPSLAPRSLPHNARSPAIPTLQREASIDTSRPSDVSSSDRSGVHPFANPNNVPAPLPAPVTPLPRTPARDLLENVNRPVSPDYAVPRSALRPGTGGIRQQSAGGRDFGRDRAPQPSRRPSSPAILPSAPINIPTMHAMDGVVGSPHKLISLEQAKTRAQKARVESADIQAREHTLSSISRFNGSSTLVAGVGLPSGVTIDPGVRTSIATQNSPEPLMHRPRSRTVSGKSKFAESDAMSTPPKTLKNKKSAFLKLFNGGKDRERDQLKASIAAPTQPVMVTAGGESMIGDLVTSQALSESSIATIRAPAPQPVQHSVKRVPPPPLIVMSSSSSSGRMVNEGSNKDPTARNTSTRAKTVGPAASSKLISAQQNNLLHPSEFTPRTAPPTTSTFNQLSIRPVSTMFSDKFMDLMIPQSSDNDSSHGAKLSKPSPTGTTFSDASRKDSLGSSVVSDVSPYTPTSATSLPVPRSRTVSSPLDEQRALVKALQSELGSSRKAHQLQIWELEGQVKDLKAEIEVLKTSRECEACGNARRGDRAKETGYSGGVLDRPRPRMGGSARTMFGGKDDGIGM